MPGDPPLQGSIGLRATGFKAPDWADIRIDENGRLARVSDRGDPREVAYYLLGHNSYLFNLIGLSSPILILIAVRIHKPGHPGAVVPDRAGQFVFIAGDIVSYNYLKLAEVSAGAFPAGLQPQPARRRAVPVDRRWLVPPVYPFLIAGIPC